MIYKLNQLLKEGYNIKQYYNIKTEIKIASFETSCYG